MLRPPPADHHVSLPARRLHRRGVVLGLLGLFQLWLWGTRIVNLLGETDSFSAAFIAVHLALYVAAIGAGLVLLALGWRCLVEARDGGRASSVRDAEVEPSGAGGPTT